uniref:Translation initiation factor eIF2B subunit beta n=1 Tax=Tetradesmus obliquus TaxID=3088 RepID=A0A383VHC3_TETOB|eukprot:jgi/Sobl393_1/15625/SZX64611.1
MNLSNLVEEYCTQLRRRQIKGSFACAKKTAEVMRLLITTQRHPDAASLIEDVRTVGTKLQAAKPVELGIGNIVRRVLHMIREEQQQEQLEASEGSSTPGDASKGPQGPGLLSQAFRPGSNLRAFNRAVSLSNLLDTPAMSADGLSSSFSGILTAAADAVAAAAAGDAQAADAEGMRRQQSSRKGRAPPQWSSKNNVIEMLNELLDELDGIEQQIAQQAVEHIHANEVILTYGMSDTTFLFLKEASRKREFQVVVAEAAPRFDGHTMARQLADAKVQTTLIADSAVFAMMARANKVLVGAHAVLANGGVIAPAGVHMVALAAKRHSIPFVVLVGLHKLSPLFPHDPDVTLNDFQSPGQVVDFDVLAESFMRGDEQQPGPDAAAAECLSVEVHNPAYDYIPPHLISLFVTDTGGYTPAYVYRLLAEYYSREDYSLDKELIDRMKL